MYAARLTTAHLLYYYARAVRIPAVTGYRLRDYEDHVGPSRENVALGCSRQLEL